MKKIAVLKDNFETRIKKKMVKGKEVEEVVPKYKKGQRFEIFEFNLFWLRPEEKGGMAINLAMMEYLRLTFPDGTPTKYFDLFEIVDATGPKEEETTPEDSET